MSQRSKLATIISTAGGIIITGLLVILFMGRAAINGNADLVHYHTVIGELASTVKLPAMTDGGRPTRRNPQAISILLVEDHKDSAEVMSRLLRAKGYSVETCATVAEALKIASERDFNLILSDIGLPDGTGIDLIRQIREHSSIPAIALTGFGMDQDINRYKEAGFDAHLTKPVNIQKLEMLINQFFSNGSGHG